MKNSNQTPNKQIIFLASRIKLDKSEEKAISNNFNIVNNRMSVLDNSICIGRYCCVPFYEELVLDLSFKNSTLINSLRQHRWIADIGNWYDVLKNFTPKTWNRLEQVPRSEYPIVIKGQTNSKKFLWDTHMYAASFEDAIKVTCNLMSDGWLEDQQLYFRKFIPLTTYLTGFRNMPVTKEFRVFVFKKQILSIGYYWSNYIEDIKETPKKSDIPMSFLNKIVDLIGDYAYYYAVDIGETKSGEWVVIEINDGQMSGLSENDPEELYLNLKNQI